MKDLIERLERLDGPCRECDLDIWWETKANRGSSNAPMPDDYRASNLRMNDAPRYTGSIDAAMSLVPDGCKDSWSLIGGAYWQAEVDNEIGDASTPAIALCIASLRSMGDGK